MFLYVILATGLCKILTNQTIQVYKGWNHIESSLDFISQANLFEESIHIHFNNSMDSHILICSSKHDDNEQFNILDNIGCAYPINSKDQESMKILFEQVPSDFELLFQTYSYKNTTFYIEIYVEQDCEGLLTIHSEPKSECLSPCLNGGVCQQGFCQCQSNFIGSDCSLEIEKLESNVRLDDSKLYYINIMEYQLIQFIQSTKYYMDCYELNPVFSSYQNYRSDYIIFSQEQEESCLNKIQELQQYTTVQLQPYFIVFIEGQSSEYEITNLTTIIIAGTLGGVVILILILLCCYRRRRQYILKSQQSIVLISIKILDQYMPVQEFERIKKEVQELQNNYECAICLQNVKQDDSLRVTYCKHVYHDHCIQQWLKGHNTCPICRSSLDVKALQEHHHPDQTVISHRNEQHHDSLIKT